MYIDNDVQSNEEVTVNAGNSLNPSRLYFDLPAMIQNMQHKRKWLKGGIDTMILLKNPVKKVLLSLIHEGTEIVSFQSDRSIILQIIEGKITLQLRNESLTLDRGEVFTIDENISYGYETIEDTALLLTISGAHSLKVVK